MRPESNKGYVIAARTAARFMPNTQVCYNISSTYIKCVKSCINLFLTLLTKLQTIVLSPQKYQPDNTRPKVFIPNRTPFNSTNLRFRTKSVDADCNPG